jgi:16S rRNA U516 pseudouridylate synthase RsuA-like enzyme
VEVHRKGKRKGLFHAEFSVKAGSFLGGHQRQAKLTALEYTVEVMKIYFDRLTFVVLKLHRASVTPVKLKNGRVEWIRATQDEILQATAGERRSSLKV